MSNLILTKEALVAFFEAMTETLALLPTLSNAEKMEIVKIVAKRALDVNASPVEVAVEMYKQLSYGKSLEEIYSSWLV